MLILEKTRNQLVSDSKNVEKEKDGKTRYEKRLKSKISSSVQEYNNLDMNKFFKEDILDINIRIHGETNSYITTLSFSNVLDKLQTFTRNKELELHDLIRAITIAFNTDNVYIHCNCPDFQFRFNYWITKKDLNSGAPEIRPSLMTNPDDKLGDGCKHIMLILSNTSWIIKVARVIYNYINFMNKNKPRLYADIIYPALYGKKYEEPVQLDLDTSNELETDSDMIDKSNQYARTKNQFKPGNQQGIRFTSNNNQISIDDEEEVGQ